MSIQHELFDNVPTEELERILHSRRDSELRINQEKRKSYESLRTDMIISLCTGALDLQSKIIEFKRNALNDIDSFYTLLQEYSLRHKDGKGNFTLDEGNFRIKYRNRTIMEFDERATEAKKHIIEFIDKRWEGDEDTRKLIKTLLNEQSSGQLDAKDVNKLYSMEDSFNDVNWLQGIKLLKESYKETRTKSYISFYQKDSQGMYKPIILNFPTLEV